MQNEGIDYSNFIDSIIIAKENKKTILEELKKRNIDEDTLYININKIKAYVEEYKTWKKENI